jgi:hypothetical protein
MLKKSSSLLFVVFSLFLAQCSKDSTTPTPSGSTTRSYGGSASFGDLISFDYDDSKKTYSITNETTGKSASGTYASSTTTGLNGIYTVTTTQGTYYAAEISNKFLAANVPSGRTDNKISVAVTADIDNSNNWANIAGTYTFISIDNTTQGSSKDWGIVEVNSDKTFTAYAYSSDVVSPEDLTAKSPFVQYDGTFALQSNHKERLTVSFKNGTSPTGKNWTGFVYATSSEAAIVLDRGEGEGFLLAIKQVPGITLSSISGSYKYITFDGGSGKSAAGNVTINQSTGTFSEAQNGGSPETGTITGLAAVPGIENMFLGYNNNNDKIYAAMCGSMFFMVLFDSNGFVKYGVGGKI